MADITRIPHKRSFTTAERFIDSIRDELFASQLTWKELSSKCTYGDQKVAETTVANLASGKTKWPRPQTLFPIMHALGIELTATYRGRKHVERSKASS